LYACILVFKKSENLSLAIVSFVLPVTSVTASLNVSLIKAKFSVSKFLEDISSSNFSLIGIIFLVTNLELTSFLFNPNLSACSFNACGVWKVNLSPTLFVKKYFSGSFFIISKSSSTSMVL